MSKPIKIVITGSPGSGKTSYVALSLCCIYQMSAQKNSPYSLWTEDTQKETVYIMDYPQKMKKGEWPSKTQIQFDGFFNVDHDNPICIWPRCSTDFQMIDLPGELCSRETLTEQLSHDTGDLKALLERVREAKYFMLMVDVTRLEDAEADEQKDTLRGISDILNDIVSPKIRIAIVFTKCDRLNPDLYPEEKREDLLRRKFQEYHAAASKVFSKATIRYFCVSCLPKGGHRDTDVKRGVIATKDWSWEDMKTQLQPWIWIFKQESIFGKCKWLESAVKKSAEKP